MTELTESGPRFERRELPANRAQPVAGWVVVPLSQVEDVRPGFIWSVMLSRPIWRQALFAALARGLIDRPDEFLLQANGTMPSGNWTMILQQLADALLAMKPRSIIEASYGSCPDGLLGGLDKLGFAPEPQPFYPTFFDVFARPGSEAKRRRKVIMELRRVDADRLEAALTLDVRLLSPGVLVRVNTARAAERMNEQVQAVLRLCSGHNIVTLRDLIASERGRRFPFTSWFTDALRSADRLPNRLPMEGDESFTRVSPANAKAFGLQLGNCLDADRALCLLTGVRAMVVDHVLSLLYEMMLLDGGAWTVARVHMPRNQEVPRDKLLKVRERLQPFGIDVPVLAEPPDVWAIVKEVGGAWIGPDFDLPD